MDGQEPAESQADIVDEAASNDVADATAADDPAKMERKRRRKRLKSALAADAAHAEEHERPFEISEETIAAVGDAVDASDRKALIGAVETLHAADVADLLEQLNADRRRAFVELLGDALPADVLAELEEGVRDDVLATIAPEQLAEAVKELDSDEVVYLVEDMAPEEQAQALAALDPSDRVAVEQSLSHPEYSAGRMMQAEIVWSPAHATVGEMIDRMRAEDDLPTDFFDVVVVDERHEPIGMVSLGKLMATRRPIALGAIMQPPRAVFRVDQPQEEVGYAFNQYHMISAPVVDAAGRLVGVISIDDAMRALDEEAEEDLLRLGGVGDEGLADTVGAIVARRFPWLAINLATAVLASLVIGLFDDALEQIVALAILMPIVASMGGNAGTQTLTVAVRALATKDLTATNAMRIVGRETLVGLFNGFAFAAIVGVIGLVWFGDPWIGVVLAVAMVLNMLIAGVAGILIPMGLARVGADPALASGVFVTTVTDVVGFLAFLGVAVLILL